MPNKVAGTTQLGHLLEILAPLQRTTYEYRVPAEIPKVPSTKGKERIDDVSARSPHPS
jgi:hypothetical protein